MALVDAGRMIGAPSALRRTIAVALPEAICATLVKGNWRRLAEAHISSSVVDHVLTLLRPDDSLCWSFFKWSLSLPNHTHHSLHSNWNMVHLLIQNGRLSLARQLLETFAFRELLSSPAVLGALLRTHENWLANSQILSWILALYSKSKPVQDGIEVFEYMRDNGFRPDCYACNALLSTLAKARLTATAWKMFDEMLRLGVVPNTYVFNAMVHVCYKSRDADRAERLITEMGRKGVLPDLYTYNTLISLFCKKGMHYEALAIQDRMKREGIPPDIVTYNSLINGFCKEGRMREAWRLFKELKDVVPNQVTYTTLIDGYCRVNDLDEALRLFKEMGAKGIDPGVVTYNAVIRKLCEQGKMRIANELLNEMDERKIEPDNVTCNTLINAYCKRGDMEFALKLRNKMLESGLLLDQYTYKALIHGFCKAHELEEAKKTLLDMMDAGFAPNYCTYSWIVDGYCEQDNVEAIMGIPAEISKRCLSADKSMYRALIRRLCKRRFVDCALILFVQMKDNGIMGDSLVLASLAHACFSAGNHVAASEILNEMASEQILVTARVYNSLNASYAKEQQTLDEFWGYVFDRGLISKTLFNQLQQARITS